MTNDTDETVTHLKQNAEGVQNESASKAKFMCITSRRTGQTAELLKRLIVDMGGTGLIEVTSPDIEKLIAERDTLRAEVERLEDENHKLKHDDPYFEDNVRLVENLASAREEFKNFHANLCKRFGYCHDEKDWRRDQASLEEHIAKQLTALHSTVRDLKRKRT